MPQEVPVAAPGRVIFAGEQGGGAGGRPSAPFRKRWGSWGQQTLQHGVRSPRWSASGRSRSVRPPDPRPPPDETHPGRTDFGGRLGHTGFVERVNGRFIHTVEGDTDASGTRQGGGAYARMRKVEDGDRGFIDYAGT